MRKVAKDGVLGAMMSGGGLHDSLESGILLRQKERAEMKKPARC